MNKELRKNALSWWRNLTEKEKETLVLKHFPNIQHIVLVSSSSSRIEQIWINEGMK